MRIFQIDGLRGFALFGILVVNIFVFHAPYAHYSEFYGQFEGGEGAVLEHMIFFFGGKFMFIYAFLFGYSFWMQYEKMPQTALFRAFWNRRMLLLAGFGILHILLLSFGDILLPYAILGLSLPFFAQLSNRQLWTCFVLIYCIPLYEFIWRDAGIFPSIIMEPVESLETYLEINRHGSWVEQLELRLKDYFSLRNQKSILYIPKEMGLFLLGMLAGRHRLATHLKPKLGTLFCVLALIVVAVMYGYQLQIIAAFDYENDLVQRSLIGLIIQVSELMHGLLYILGFFLLWRIAFLQKGLFLLTYPGKLSLSNYILQSVFCVGIFSGLGYYGSLTPSQLVLLAIAIYGLQLLCSRWWLSHYAYGPLESIWRKYAKVKREK